MKWLHILLLAGLVIFRFAYLDQDTPTYSLTNVCQEDEPYYSLGAIHQLCADEGRQVSGFEKTKGDFIDMYSRLLMYPSLKVFGNNYWGLRIPDVLISLLLIWLIFSMFKKLGFGGDYLQLLVLLLFTNFYLFTFSRYHNPQIFSIFGIVLTLWIVVKYGCEKPLPLVAAGFAAMFCVLFIYPMNFFLLAGLGLFILIRAISEKKYLLPVYFAAGIVICFLAFAVSLQAIGSSMGTFMHVVLNYGQGNDVVTIGGHTSLIRNVVNGFTSIINTGYFRFQLPLLFLSVVSIPLLIFKIRDKNAVGKEWALLILLILGCQFLQNCFTVTYTFKKMLVDIPVTVMAVFIASTYFNLQEVKANSSKKWIMVIAAAGAFLCCLFNFKTNNSAVYWGYTGIGCYETTLDWFNGINVCLCVMAAIVFIYSLFSSSGNFQSIIKTVLIVSVISNMALSFNTFVLNRKYQVRDSLVELKPIIHNKVTTGGFPFAWQFYTGSKPALNGYPIDILKLSRAKTLDSMLVNKEIDYDIEKVMNGKKTDSSSVNPNLQLVKVFSFNCYSYYLYKNRLK
jgi:4-amino-4-deoxy-L-arabinose transferase-like glycosyltransferase